MKGMILKMNKTELLEVLKEVGDNDDVLETLKGIEGLAKSSELDTSKLTIEDFKQILEKNEQIKGYNQSQLDSAVSKGVESFKNNKMQKYIDDALKESNNKDKTPEQIKLEELQQQLDNMQKEKTRAEMSSKYTKVLGEKGLNAEFIDFVLGADDDSTTANIEKINNIINSQVQNGVKAKFSDSAYVPPKQDTNSNTITKEQFKKMGYKEKLNLFNENNELYKNLKNEGEM